MMLCFLLSPSHHKTRGSRAAQLEGDQGLEFFCLVWDSEWRVWISGPCACEDFSLVSSILDPDGDSGGRGEIQDE